MRKDFHVFLNSPLLNKYFIRRSDMNKCYVDNEKCKRCGLCEKECNCNKHITVEEYNLSTCINGFVSLFSKAVVKYLNIDKNYRIYTAAVIGHPGNTFHQQVIRDDSTIECNWPGKKNKSILN